MLSLPRIRKKVLISLLSTLVLLFSIAAGVVLVQQQQELRSKAAGNTYYVATNGSDGNPGTLAKPWRTIGKANSALQAGDTVRIRSGTYNEVIGPSRSGTSGNPITYTSYQNEEAVIRGNSAQKYLARITGSYTVIDGLTFRHAYRREGQSGWILIESGSSKFNIIRNNKIITEDADLQWPLPEKRKFLDKGIIVKRAKDTLIESNLIRGMQIGVSVWRNGQRTIIRGNTITETFQSPIVVGGSTSTPTIQGILIENNVLEKSLIEDGIQFHPNYDLPKDQQEKDVSAIGIVVRNNIFRYNAENAIDLKGAGNVVIEGNIIYGTEGDNDGPLECGCHCAGNGNDRCSFSTIMKGSRTTSRDVIIRNNVMYDNTNAVSLYTGWKVYNNTIVGNNRDFTGPNSTWTGASNAGFHGIKSLGARDNGIKNNIIAEENHAEIYMNVNSVSGLDINNNLYWNSGGANFRNTTDNRSFENRNFEQWKSDLRGNNNVSGNDEQGLVCKPEFVNVPSSLRPVGVHTNFDFRYTGNCPLVGASLTQTVGASSGRQIRVIDARFFFDGFGVVAGDQIIVGNNSPVTATVVNYSTNTITVDRSISWKSNDSVTLSFPGSTPPVGAFEFGSPGGPPLPPPTTSTPTPTKVPTNTPTSAVTSTPPQPGTNLIKNPSFEDGTQNWLFFTDEVGTFTTSSPAYEGVSAAKVAITTEGSNVQLYQKGISLEPNTQYRLSFAAFSNTGHDLEVKFHKHGSPYTNYELASDTIDLGTSWKSFSIPFTTNDLGGTSVADARLRFWMAPYDEAGDEYLIDAVLLTKTSTTCNLIGDINCDGVVNILDFQALNNNFGTNNPDSDLNNDGIVNILDFQILNNNFGETGG